MLSLYFNYKYMASKVEMIPDLIAMVPNPRTDTKTDIETDPQWRKHWP